MSPLPKLNVVDEQISFILTSLPLLIPETTDMIQVNDGGQCSEQLNNINNLMGTLW
jgi:hypothetical protein